MQLMASIRVGDLQESDGIGMETAGIGTETLAYFHLMSFPKLLAQSNPNIPIVFAHLRKMTLTAYAISAPGGHNPIPPSFQ